MRSLLSRYSSWTPLLLRTLTGVLLFTASFSRFLFAPDLIAGNFPPVVERVFLAIQLLTGLGLMIGLFPRIMSAFGLTLYLFSLFLFPLPNVLSYIGFVGIFLYLIIVGDPTLPRVRGVKIFPHTLALLHLAEIKPYAMAILRIFAGLSFVIVGFLYKLYEPAHALEFIRAQPVNFMPQLGFVNFSNELFVLSAGIVEMLVGVFIILGLLPRLMGAVLFVLFTITMSYFGIYELLGHLPLYAVAFALLTQGGGERWSCELVRKKIS